MEETNPPEETPQAPETLENAGQTAPETKDESLTESPETQTPADDGLPDPAVLEAEESPLLATETIEEQAYTHIPGQDEDDGESPPDNPMRGHTKGFALMGAQLYTQYVPQIMSSLFRYSEHKLIGLPEDTILAVRQLNLQINEGFAMGDNQKEMLQNALDAYLKTVNFKQPSPLSQLIFVALMPVLSGSLMAWNMQNTIESIVLDAVQKTKAQKQAQAA